MDRLAALEAFVRVVGRHLSAKVRSFIDLLRPRYGEQPYWDAWMSGPIE